MIKKEHKKLLRLSGDAYMAELKKLIGNEDNDCVVRSISRALEIPYWQAHKLCLKAGRPMKHGIHVTSVLGYKSSVVFGHRVGLHKNTHKTVRTFVKKHPKGTYLLVVYKHAFTLKDGQVQGLWEGDFGQVVKYYYYVSKVKKAEVPAENTEQKVA